MRQLAFVVILSLAGCQSARFGQQAESPWWSPSGPAHSQDGFIDQGGNATPVYTPGSHQVPHIVNQGQLYSNGPPYYGNPGGYAAFGGGPQYGPPMHRISYHNRYQPAPQAQYRTQPSFRSPGISSRQCTTSG